MKAGTILDGFRALPLAMAGEALPGTTLVPAPHADDESLGCGGLIAALCASGRPPVVVVVTDGAGSHPGSRLWPPDRLRARRRLEVDRATTLLGLPAGRLLFLDQPDTEAPQAGPLFDRAVDTVSAIARRHRCDTLLASWEQDPHCDHLAAWLIGRATAARNGLALRAYPVWGWCIPPDTELDCDPPRGWRVDIAPFLPAKAAAIAAHESQHGGLITDDPDGFALPDRLLSVFRGQYETVLLP